ncbi:hypothetical protein CEE37_04075 [candidate division LCP-89 bacterium B3_LCP]|uniref:Uncharacterized protein n=1 Tax=candidate division LCP-89 bacterium B3_LCP TaxID=2012998 RepID=A0A532V3G0_UNCL8|nr:MAG: hypothetical protein CEE37_04075 [candidate division LCP-89 bacterium B3_LCP]
MIYRLQILIRFAIIILVMVTLAVSGDCQSQNEDNAEFHLATVLKVIPPVQVRHFDTEEFAELKQDDLIFPGDRIVCSDGGYAALLFSDSAVELKLFPNSELTLQGQSGEDGFLKRLFLPVGILWTKLFRGNLEVITPTSVASVKGTEWWTIVESTSQTRVVVIVGEVEVKHRITGISERAAENTTAITTPSGEIDLTPTEEFIPPKIPSVEKNQTLEIELEDSTGQKKTIIIKYSE